MIADRNIEEFGTLEPMVAHGSRMSWAGLKRPGNEFASTKKSQLAILTSETGEPLKRYFGKWNSAFKRFTTNISSAKIKVQPLLPIQNPTQGIQCILHWVSRQDMIRSDRGSVCYGDGWPVALWDAFLSQLENLPEGSVAEKLRIFLESELEDSNKFVAAWRTRVRDAKLTPQEEWTELDQSWLPVPATLEVKGKSSACIVSWSPAAPIYRSISEALASPQGIRNKPDLTNQAKYYLECTLAKLHGVSFENPNDLIEDSEYAGRPEVRKITDAYMMLEKERIQNPNLGKLDRPA